VEKFSELMRGNDLIVAPVALSPIMARLAEEAGFKAVYLSGGSLGWLKCVTEANLTLPELAAVALDMRARSSFEASNRRKRTNARMISMLTATARLLRRTLDNIATPCSVNAYGAARRRPPQLEVTIVISSFKLPLRKPEHKMRLDLLNFLLRRLSFLRKIDPLSVAASNLNNRAAIVLRPLPLTAGNRLDAAIAPGG